MRRWLFGVWGSAVPVVLCRCENREVPVSANFSIGRRALAATPCSPSLLMLLVRPINLSWKESWRRGLASNERNYCWGGAGSEYWYDTGSGGTNDLL